MTKLTAILLAIIIGVVAMLGVALERNYALKHEAQRARGNFEAVIEGLERTKQQNEINMQVLKLTKNELTKHNIALKRNLQDLGIKLKQVTNATLATSQGLYNLHTTIHDTVIVVRDSLNIVFDTIHALRTTYSDRWITFEQVQAHNQAQTHIATFDSLLVVQHVQQRKFLFFRWGEKKRITTVKNYNPYSSIKYAVSVQVVDE